MTLAKIRSKIISYWWIIILVSIATTLLFLPRTNQKTYLASVDLGVGLETTTPFVTDSLLDLLSPLETQTEEDEEGTAGQPRDNAKAAEELKNRGLDLEDTQSASFLQYYFTELLILDSQRDLNNVAGSYLSLRYRSVATQTKISEKAELDIQAINPEIPFYRVSGSAGSYITISYEAGSEDDAKKFNQAIVDIYPEIVQDWNDRQANIFEITPKSDIETQIKENQTGIQFQIFPVFVGLLLGFVLTLFLPEKTKSNSNSSNNKAKSKQTSLKTEDQKKASKTSRSKPKSKTNTAKK